MQTTQLEGHEFMKNVARKALIQSYASRPHDSLFQSRALDNAEMCLIN